MLSVFQIPKKTLFKLDAASNIQIKTGPSILQLFCSFYCYSITYLWRNLSNNPSLRTTHTDSSEKTTLSIYTGWGVGLLMPADPPWHVCSKNRTCSGLAHSSSIKGFLNFCFQALTRNLTASSDHKGKDRSQLIEWELDREKMGKYNGCVTSHQDPWQTYAL